MNDNPVKSGTDRAKRVTAEQSLNEALSSLEQILERGQDAKQGTTTPAAAPRKPEAGPSIGGEAGDRPGSGSGAGADGGPDSSQYAIPLLHEVVMPGEESDAAGGAEESLSDDDVQACHQFVERLANEIEVIVHARVEAAVQEAADDIREQVRNHLEIMLPEILDELRQLGRRRGG